MICKKKIFLLIVVFLLVNFLYGQNKLSALTPAIRTNVIERLCNVLTSNYLFPDTAVQMTLHIRKRLETGAYDQITDPIDLAQHLTIDLLSIYKDKHLHIFYEPPLQSDVQDISYIQQAAMKIKNERDAEQQNYGFSKIQIFSGNIGYIAVNSFFDLSDQSKRAVNSAFDFLINANVLIIDLRLSGGGQAAMAEYISSLFFKKPTHITDFYIKQTNEFHQIWTEPRSQSDLWSDIPLYILVSAYTGSASEEFAYDLQSSHRAVIVGELTAGAAHPMQIMNIGNGFTAHIPFARPINPFTKTDWEGSGIKPDIVINTSRALDTAILSFYKQQINSTDTSTAKSAKWMFFIYKSKLNPYKINPKGLKRFVGNYAGNKIFIQNGHLIYNGSDGYMTRLIPISKTTFTLDSPLDNRQLIFQTNTKGRANEMYFNFNGNLSRVFVRTQNGLQYIK